MVVLDRQGLLSMGLLLLLAMALVGSPLELRLPLRVKRPEGEEVE